MRQPLVAGNWKMNGSRDLVRQMVEAIGPTAEQAQDVEVLICPPFVYLGDAQSQLQGTRVQLGAQNVSQEPKGAHTGEIAAGMLLECGCEYVIVGHSERRAMYHESDERVAEKFAAALDAGLKPILCVGETLEERNAGTTEPVVRRQLEAVLERSGAGAFGTAVIAYEPVWAIGTGHTATPEQAQGVHAFIRQLMGERDQAIADGVRILYGGSVNGENAAELFSQPDVDGGLVGGASLKPDDFRKIIQGAAR